MLESSCDISEYFLVSLGVVGRALTTLGCIKVFLHLYLETLMCKKTQVSQCFQNTSVITGCIAVSGLPKCSSPLQICRSIKRLLCFFGTQFRLRAFLFEGVFMMFEKARAKRKIRKEVTRLLESEVNNIAFEFENVMDFLDPIKIGSPSREHCGNYIMVWNLSREKTFLNCWILCMSSERTNQNKTI